MATGGMIGQRSFGESMRRDAWWLQPLVVFLGLSVFIIYTTWAAFQGKNYYYHGNGADYLSPFYSPLLFGQTGEPRWFDATQPAWWPGWLPFSAALLILIFPAGFRFTCYYYRGAYYKAFWADPPACAVGEARKTYLGEAKFPLIFQNIHRYFLYAAVIFIVLLAHDAWKAMWFTHPDGTQHFGIGLGTIVLTCNAIFLAFYTFGCHCMRHLIGGRKDCLASSKASFCAYKGISALNRRHMLWAWVSLGGVLLSDIYVRMCAMGVWTDWRLF